MAKQIAGTLTIGYSMFYGEPITVMKVAELLAKLDVVDERWIGEDKVWVEVTSPRSRVEFLPQFGTITEEAYKFEKEKYAEAKEAAKRNKESAEAVAAAAKASEDAAQ